MHGVFSTASVNDGTAKGQVLRQQTLSAPEATHASHAVAAATIFGDSSLTLYTVEVAARATGDTSVSPASGAVASGHTDNGSVEHFIFLGSHVGAFNSSFGKSGFQPAFLHDSMTVPGYMLIIRFPSGGPTANGGGNASWVMQMGSHIPCGHASCQVSVVASGEASWSKSEWLQLSVSVGSTATNTGASVLPKRRLAATVNGQPLFAPMEVDALPEARGSVALGCGYHASEWDNLTLTETK
jgi:hypothetical protein